MDEGRLDESNDSHGRRKRGGNKWSTEVRPEAGCPETSKLTSIADQRRDVPSLCFVQVDVPALKYTGCILTCGTHFKS